MPTANKIDASMKYYLAIDAGGTKTDYVLADETRTLARVRGGSIKRMRVDAATATAHLDEALLGLTQKSSVTMDRVTRTCIGTAGENVALVVDWLRAALKERVAGDLLLLSDVEIALDAAFPGEGGVLILAGTGSNVAGRIKGGAVSTVGGWGPALADQGSGHRVGQEALRNTMLAIDQGRSTSLLASILDFWQLESVEELVAFANAVPSPDFSRLTRLVRVCAEHGDALASSVLEAQGRELAYLVRLLIRRLQISAGQTFWTPPLAFAGSMMENMPPLRAALICEIEQEFPDVLCLAGVVDPIEGALARARQG